MLSQHRRPNRLDIDSGSVTRRVAALRRRVGSRVKIFAALKANGYGFGTLPMAQAALAGGADALSLIDRAEAIALRRAGIEAPILLYAGAPIDADSVAAAEIIPPHPDSAQRTADRQRCALRSDAYRACHQAGSWSGADRRAACGTCVPGSAHRTTAQSVACDRQCASDVPRRCAGCGGGGAVPEIHRGIGSAEGSPSPGTDSTLCVVKNAGPVVGIGTRRGRSRPVLVRRRLRAANHSLIADSADAGTVR